MLLATLSAAHMKSSANRSIFPGAQRLAQDDPYQFQWWALSLVGARPTEEKKGADRGIDGRLYFHDENKRDRKTKQIIFSVKAGHVQSAYVRDLHGVIDREDAQIGILICMEAPTKPMLKEAAEAGFYKPPRIGGPVSAHSDSHYRRVAGGQGSGLSALFGSDLQESAKGEGSDGEEGASALRAARHR